jgi:hypothetical protein
VNTNGVRWLFLNDKYNHDGTGDLTRVYIPISRQLRDVGGFGAVWQRSGFQTQWSSVQIRQASTFCRCLQHRLDGLNLRIPAWQMASQEGKDFFKAVNYRKRPLRDLVTRLFSCAVVCTRRRSSQNHLSSSDTLYST